jgi:hypothetical protein
MSVPIDPKLRETFRAIADILIPAAEGMPAASEVGVHEGPLDQVLALRPDIAERLLRGLRAAAGRQPREAAEALNKGDAEALSAIGLAASAAYYMQPQVRKLIGYPGQENRPANPEETPEYVANGMLQQVIDRGPIYKPTPTS